MIHMNLRNKKILAAKVLDVGTGRVVFDTERLDEIKEAITKQDINGLVIGGVIKAKPRHGASRSRFRKRIIQKRKGRQSGMGSKRGKRTARLSDKRAWINRIRLQRKYMKQLKNKGYVQSKDFRSVYRKIGGGFFRNKRHVAMYLEENKLLKKK